MKTETIDARLNAISNCMAVYDEVYQSLPFTEDATKADISAHGWLYKRLSLLEAEYFNKLKTKTNEKRKI